MYRVILLLNGYWLGECIIQDGTERIETNSRSLATKWIIQSAKVFNRSTITDKDIEYLEQKEIVTKHVKLVPLGRKR